MRDVFVSHVEEDSGIALDLARGLEKAGYTTWYYERDSIPGPSYLLQTGGAVEDCRAFVLVISPHSLSSNQVTAEVVRAHEGGKPFIPVLSGISHAEFQGRQPLWRQAVGSAASVPITAGGAGAIVPRIVAGLEALRIKPGELAPEPDVAGAASMAATPRPVAPAVQGRVGGRPVWQERRLWIGLAGVVGLMVVVVAWVKLTKPIKPLPQPPGTQARTAAIEIPPGPTRADTAAPPAGPTVAPTQPPAAPPYNLQVEVLAIEDSGSGYAWSPDGKLLVIGGSEMKLFDVQALKVTQSIRSNGTKPVFSPDGSLLALLTSEGVELWDTTAWGPALTLAGSKDTDCVAFAPDGKTLATAVGEAIKVWDVASGQELRTLPAEGHEVVAFSPDGHTLAAPSESAGDIKLWDATTGEELRTLKGHSNGITGLAFSSDGRLLASSSNDRTARLWDVAGGRLLHTLGGHTKSVDGVALSPDGRLVATASMDLTVRLWDVASGQEVKRLAGHTSWVSSVAFSPDGSKLVSGGFGEMRLWGLSEGADRGTPTPAATPRPTVVAPALSTAAISAANAAGLKQVGSLEAARVTQVAWSPDGRQLAVATNHIQLYDAETLKPGTLFDAMQSTQGFAFSPDGLTLASPWVGGVQVWDLSAGVEVLALKGSDHSTAVAFSPDGALLATACGQTVKLWEVASGRELYTLPSDDHSALAFSPVEPIVAAGAGDYDSIALWDATTGQELRKLTGLSGRPETIAFSRDGKLLAAATNDSILIWEVASGRQRRRFAPPEPQTRSLAFSPDGTVLAVASGSLIVVWDVERGDKLCTLTGHSEYIDTVAFSPDGALLASGAGDETLRLWGVAQ